MAVFQNRRPILISETAPSKMYHFKPFGKFSDFETFTSTNFIIHSGQRYHIVRSADSLPCFAIIRYTEPATTRWGRQEKRQRVLWKNRCQMTDQCFTLSTRFKQSWRMPTLSFEGKLGGCHNAWDAQKKSIKINWIYCKYLSEIDTVLAKGCWEDEDLFSQNWFLQS